MIKSGKSYSYWLARFNHRKVSFHFPWVVPLISDRSVWHNGKQPKLVINMTPGVSLTFHFQCLFELFYDVHRIFVHIVFDLISVYSFYVQRLFYLP